MIRKSTGPSLTTTTGVSKHKDMNMGKANKISSVFWLQLPSAREVFLVLLLLPQMAGDISHTQLKTSVANAQKALGLSNTTG